MVKNTIDVIPFLIEKQEISVKSEKRQNSKKRLTINSLNDSIWLKLGIGIIQLAGYNE